MISCSPLKQMFRFCLEFKGFLIFSPIFRAELKKPHMSKQTLEPDSDLTFPNVNMVTLDLRLPLFTSVCKLGLHNPGEREREPENVCVCARLCVCVKNTK